MQYLTLALLVALAAPALAGLKESCARSSKSKCRDPLSIQTVARDVELRTYRAGVFAVTEVMISSPSVGIMTYGFNMFMPLWNYMKQGSNEEGKKFEMSMPAPIMFEKQTNGMWKASLAFWLSAGSSAPRPYGMAKGVKIVAMDAQSYYVKSFSNSFSWYDFLSMSTPESMYDDNRSSLVSTLRTQGRRFVENAYANVGYDSPFVRRGRHNEVWVKALLPQ